MEKEIKIITKALSLKKIIKTDENTHEVSTPEELINTLINIDKKREIIIFDITYKKNKPNFFVQNICDHINQTGTNWLRKKQKQLQLDFVDITNLYISTSKTTTVSLGSYYEKNKTKHKNPSTDICNIAIMLRGMGYNKIKGNLVNCKL